MEKAPDKKNANNRSKRLAEQLRANLMKRKQQVRARREGEADQRRDGMPVMQETENPAHSDGTGA